MKYPLTPQTFSTLLCPGVGWGGQLLGDCLPWAPLPAGFLCMGPVGSPTGRQKGRSEMPVFLCTSYLFRVASLVDPMPSAATGSYAPIPQPLLHVFTLTGCWSGSPQPCPLKHRDGNSFLLRLVSWHLSIPYLFPYPAYTSVGSLSPTSPDTD